MTFSRCLLMVIGWGGFTGAGPLPAQTFSTLYSFSQLGNGTNQDGAAPVAGLTLSQETLYGTTPLGGTAGHGVIFAIGRDGSGFTNLHSFAALDQNDGMNPVAPLRESAGLLYGTTSSGGDGGSGTVFALRTDATDYRILHNFVAYFSRPDQPLEGSSPRSSLTLWSNMLYGTTRLGGSFGAGTVFTADTNGNDFSTLFAFTGFNDGEYPNDLIIAGDILYGTAVGGSIGGTVFAIDNSGSNFTNLYDSTNLGAYFSPLAGVVAAGDTLYGNSRAGGNLGADDGGWGSIFAAKMNGSTVTVLHRFASATFGFDLNNNLQATNSEGAWPEADLILADGTLYGTTYTGGAFGNGTVFAMKTDGTGFTNLHSFTALSMNTNRDGAHPRSALLLVGDTLFGTTSQGGTNGNGTIFSISLPNLRPQLTITATGPNIVLRWPANPAAFTLVSTTNLLPGSWTTVSTLPVVVNGENVVTNPVLGKLQFFRLSQ